LRSIKAQKYRSALVAWSQPSRKRAFGWRAFPYGSQWTELVWSSLSARNAGRVPVEQVDQERGW